MRSIAGLIVFSLFLIIHASAQRPQYASLKGTVIDSTSRQPVEAATVAVFLLADSSLVTYAITNKKGEFVLKDIPQVKPCRLLVSYTGLTSYIQDLVISPDTKELIINTIQLGKTFSEMDAVVVAAQRPPIIVKKDTLEFNAGAYRTAVNGVVEDLLKQLPGVEVDNEGNITVNGKKVSKITVDGKDFFGSDFKLTSRNLPRDIVDKIQVVDNKTREARFNKTSTGNEDKAINITLKKERKKGLFGRVNGGYGSDQRYETGGNINYYQGPTQLSLLGYANNTNRSSVSGSDLSISNPISSFSSGGRGITTAQASGMNVSHQVNPALRISGSYFFNKSAMENALVTRRQNMLPDTNFNYKATTTANSRNSSHRAFLNFDYNPDTLTSMYIGSSLFDPTGFSATGNNALSTNKEGIRLNASNNLFSSRLLNENYSIEAFAGRRLNSKGRNMTLGLSYQQGASHSLDSNKGLSVFYTPNGEHREDTIDQAGANNGSNRQFMLNAGWVEPVGRELFLQAAYSFTDNRSSSGKRTARFNPATGQYDLPDTSFTNASESRYRSHTPSLQLEYRSDRFIASIGTAAQWLTQATRSTRPARILDQHYRSLLPSVNLTYQYSKTAGIHLNYSGRSQQPTADQLQAAPDNTNPLYITLGNPDLRPSFYHAINLNLQQYMSKSYFNAGMSATVAANQIVSESWFDSVQYIRPVNSHGNWGLSLNASYSYGWKRPGWSLRIAANAAGNYNKNVTYSNKLPNRSQTYSWNQRLSITYLHKELFTLMPVLMVGYSDTRYGFQQPQPAANLTGSIQFTSFVNWPKNCILENNIQYNYNSRTAPGFPKAVTMWNLAINYQLLKNKQASLRLAAFDLLRQNTSVFRFVTPAYIEDTQAQVLQQYFLISVQYNLQQFRR